MENEKAGFSQKLEDFGEWWADQPIRKRIPLGIIGGACLIVTLLAFVTIAFLLLIVWPIKFLGWWSLLLFGGMICAGLFEFARADMKKQKKRVEDQKRWEENNKRRY